MRIALIAQEAASTHRQLECACSDAKVSEPLPILDLHVAFFHGNCILRWLNPHLGGLHHLDHGDFDREVESHIVDHQDLGHLQGVSQLRQHVFGTKTL